MDWRLALVAFSVLPLIALVTQWFRRHVRESYRQVRTWIARINAFLQERISGMATVQLYRREARDCRRLRRHQPRAPRRQRGLDLLLRRVLSGHRAGERAGGRPAPVGGRRVGAAGRADARVAGGLPAVLAAVLPADQRPLGEVQRAAGRDGLVRAHLHAARHAGGDRVAAGRHAGAARRRSASSTSASPTCRASRCSRTCRSRCSRASAWASSARRVRARPR